MLKFLKYIFCLFVFIYSFNCSFAENVDTLRIKSDLKAIVETKDARNYVNLEVLNQVADYIKTEFLKTSTRVEVQEFQVEGGNTYKNIICSFGPEDAPRTIIGAHYDVCGNQKGADDNATGIVGLLEIARNLKGVELKNRIDLVAYSLEEPPFFKTESMGSYIHAKSLHDKKVIVKGMICLEMIGYFSDIKKSQNYPVGFLKIFYGNKGNYITVVKKFCSGSFTRKFNRKFKHQNIVRTKTFTGPKFLPGVDFSDHLNYWIFGYSALMITDTAFYRNLNYHTKADTIEKLDIKRMSLVIESVLKVLTL
ncbi:MAG: M28 family peptidase [Bacteroidia bacterium]|nr:M28 family peptidase [Bacteroidia bacterium]